MPARPTLLATAGALVALAVACVLSLLVGARTVPLDAAWQAALAFDPGSADHVVLASRLQRTLAGLAVGVALALAGAGLQGMTRNPLADPGILGLNSGAAAAVATGVYLFSFSSVTQFMAAGFVGAALAAVLVYALAAASRTGATPITLAIAGAAVTAGLGSLVHALVILDQGALDRMRLWQVGTLGARDLGDLAAVAPALLIGAVIVLGAARALNALALGDDAAAGLGVHVGRTRVVLGVGIVLLVGAAVSLAGPVGFLGLVVPHAVRLLVGSDHRRLLPLTALLGPVVLLLADVVGRVIAPPAEVQVGVMTALLGVPVFLVLIRTRKRVAL
ncbi:MULTISPECIES: FecCD family ABC transporter permease [Brachybacterium]|uniref:Iron ABC transporter permease n=2 Tax=Brachybacterium TaxID=43668 RepID=A0A3R8RQ89_9MICO|nr:MULTISPECIES: iron ABC transporter permease [Brachybacterium]RRR18137.1 iron ABC transporter permease [Brachybacterium paraconglomeratum]GLI30234.1 iron ABC transporter permease [Brachybacterium conglomeratum]GLK04772.1 iron ABC transporter permease [Brachybacterium conglomeratum]